MNHTIAPSEEYLRLQALRKLNILDTESDKDFTGIVKLASQICKTPVSLVTLIDHDRQWFKANVGLDGIKETPRDISFCTHAIQNDHIMVVEDATKDPRFKDNVLVTGAPKIRFYAGMPLIIEGRYKVGTLCVVDLVPKTITDEQRHSLKILAEQAVSLINLRLSIEKLRLAESLLQKTEGKYKLLSEMASDFIALLTPEGKFTALTSNIDLLGYECDELIDNKVFDFVHYEDTHLLKRIFQRRVLNKESIFMRFRMIRKDQTSIWIEAAVKVELQQFFGQ